MWHIEIEAWIQDQTVIAQSAEAQEGLSLVKR
jgi:hypothetical protein